MRKDQKSMVVLAIAMAFVVVGTLLPKLIGADELELSTPSGPTIKALIPPTWSQKLDASQRFELVLDGTALVDKETGLVWDKLPDIVAINWNDACVHCYQREVGGVGGRKGWRLPTVEELASLIDTNQSNPALPSGHPFDNVLSAYYWSSSTNTSLTSNAWIVHFGNGIVTTNNKQAEYNVWCVRGRHGHDAY